MNRSDIRKRILLALDEDVSSPSYYTIAEVNGWIDEGLEVLSEETKIRLRRGHISLRAGMRFYSIEAVDPRCFAITQIWLQDRERALGQTSMLELSREGNKWMRTESERPFEWFPVDTTTFGIHPVPTASNDILRVDYYAWAAPTTDDVAELELDDGTADALVYYGVYLGYMKRYDVTRAADAFTDFSSVFSDGVYRNEIGKFSNGLRQRLTYVAPDSF